MLDLKQNIMRTVYCKHHSNETVNSFSDQMSAISRGRFMKAQTATNNWPWKRKCKLQWMRINGNANWQFIRSKFTCLLCCETCTNKGV